MEPADDIVLGDPEALEIAFAWRLLEELARADGVVTREEEALSARLCPPAVLAAAGLVGADGQPTALGRAARARAPDALRVRLALPDKLRILGQLFELCVVDGQLDREEGSMLLVAAGLLGVRPWELDAHLDTLTDHVGAVDADALEPET